MKLIEGVYDPGKLKAVLLGGGCGAGKSYTIGRLFGLIDKDKKIISSKMSHYGLRTVSSDQAFEYLLNQKGIDPRKLHLLPTDVFNQLSDLEDSTSVRSRARKLTNLAYQNYKNGRLGIIIDSNANDMNYVRNMKDDLESIGYDVVMIFVYTDLNKALERNNNRERVLPEYIVKRVWEEATRNVNSLKTLFNPNFYLIDNSYDTQDNIIKAEKFIKKFLSKPIQNPIGKEWIKNELELKNKLNTINEIYIRVIERLILEGFYK